MRRICWATTSLSPVSGSVSAPGWGSEQFPGTDLQGLPAALYVGALILRAAEQAGVIFGDSGDRGDAGPYPAAIMALRSRRRETDPDTSFTLQIADASPWLIGDQGRGIGGSAIGSRGDREVPGRAGVCAAVPPARPGLGVREGAAVAGHVRRSACQPGSPRQVDCVGVQGLHRAAADRSVGMTEDMQAADTGDAVAGEVVDTAPTAAADPLKAWVTAERTWQWLDAEQTWHTEALTGALAVAFALQEVPLLSVHEMFEPVAKGDGAHRGSVDQLRGRRPAGLSAEVDQRNWASTPQGRRCAVEPGR